MIGFIQHGLATATLATSTLAWLGILFTLMLGSLISSIVTSRGVSSVANEANVASESACLFCDRATWDTFTVSN